jgi:hypothetical protein
MTMKVLTAFGGGGLSIKAVKNVAATDRKAMARLKSIEETLPLSSNVSSTSDTE